MKLETGLLDRAVLQRHHANRSAAKFTGTSDATGDVQARVMRGKRAVPGLNWAKVGTAARGKLAGVLRGVPAGGPYTVQLRIVDAQKRTLDALQKGALIADPGMTEKKIKEERKRVGDILEKARSLSDVDFEMEKENLAAQIKAGTPQTPEHLQNFNSAFFLLMPGSVRVYDKLIEHIDRQKSLDEGDKEKEK